MPTYKLENVNIFSTDTELYLSSGDDHITKFFGEDKNLIEMVLRRFEKTPESLAVFESLRSESSISRESFDLALNHLIQNQILIPERSTTKFRKNIIVIGALKDITKIKNYFELSDTKEIKYHVLSTFTSYCYEDIVKSLSKDVDMVILLSPLLTNTKGIRDFSDALYSRNLPILCAGAERSSIFLGPIVDPLKSTPGLSCYIRRKIAGLKDPKEMLSITKLQNIKYINKIDLSSNPLFSMLLELIRLELDRYFLYDTSRIISKEIELDSVSYTTKISKIFKTEYFKPNYPVKPFNG